MIAWFAPRGRPLPGPQIDVSAAVPEATAAIVAIMALVALFFALRVDLWRRLWFRQVDPRPAGILRIAYGLVLLWALLDFVPYARLLFTDEGIFLTKLARSEYGGAFAYLWDPRDGFQHWYDVFPAFWHRFSLLHARSDPPFAFALFGASLCAVALMTLGVWTRWTTVAAWLLVNSLLNYNPMFYTGGDSALRLTLFYGVFCRWGAAYSIDAWRAHRRSLLEGRGPRPRPKIPVWPLRLIILQLAVIYCASGVQKAGVGWRNGEALYYATSLEHFFRVREQIYAVVLLQKLGLLQLFTWLIRFWELLFPVVLVGELARTFDREPALWSAAPRWRRWAAIAALGLALVAGSHLAGLYGLYYHDPRRGPAIDRETARWLLQALVFAGPIALVLGYQFVRRHFPAVTRAVLPWILGRRVWLTAGVVFHLGIEAMMNVGTFVQAMLVMYFAWLRPEEIEALFRFAQSRPLRAGEGGRPRRVGVRRLLAPLDRLRHRAPRPKIRVGCVPGDGDGPTLREALLRPWDLGGRLECFPDADAQALVVITGDGQRRTGDRAAAALIPALPALWVLAPAAKIPGLERVTGRLVRAILRLEDRARGATASAEPGDAARPQA